MQLCMFACKYYVGQCKGVYLRTNLSISRIHLHGAILKHICTHCYALTYMEKNNQTPVSLNTLIRSCCAQEDNVSSKGSTE